MLGIGGRFAGAKGMVQMPDLADLNPEQAAALLVANGLKVRNQNPSNTTNSGLSNKIFDQSFVAGDLVDYETAIDFSYYLYTPPAVVITFGPAEEYQSPTLETGCNQSPNNQNASNQYFYCSRNTRYYRSKKYEDGIWNGEYGQYITISDTNWDCVITAGQCGNTVIEEQEISGTRSECIGSPNTTGYQNVNYRLIYKAGTPTNLTVTRQVFGCQVPPAEDPPGPCPGGIRITTTSNSSCKCGYQDNVYTSYCADGGSGAFIYEQFTSSACKETPGSEYTTPVYWFSCGYFVPNQRKGTYRIETYDCAGTLISNNRYEIIQSCCTASCGSWSAWIKVATWVESRTRTCTRDDCTTYTETETRCIPHCDIWRTVSGCLGTYKLQQRKCQAADCSFYYETRKVSC